MSEDVRFKINGKDFGLPRNWQDIEITVDWLNKKDSGDVNVTDLSFVGKANEYLQERIMDGLNGGVGIFEGDPCLIEVGKELSPEFELDMYLDFTQEATKIGGEEIVVGLKKTQGDDWLNDVADVFSFAYLYDQGVITDGDFKRIPYVINYIPDGLELLILALSIYAMTKEIVENTEKVLESIAEVTDAGTPVIGTSVGVGAGVVTAWDLGNFILTTLKTVARIAYVLAMSIAMVKLMEEVFLQLLPPVKYHLGMTWGRMMQRACDHLGLKFRSDLLLNKEKDTVYIPVKSRDRASGLNLGFPSNTESIYTFAGLIRELKLMYNADYRIRDGVFVFERRDFFDEPAVYMMPSYFGNQERLLDNVKFNTDEMVANYNIHYALDVQDQNTLDLVDGRVFQAITSPKRVIDQRYVNIKNLVEIALPFSLGRDKQELTTVEKVLKDLAKIVDGITGVFGKSSNFANRVENRKGSLLLSSPFLTIGKIVKMSGSKLSPEQRTLLDARKLWDNYHFINSFAMYQGEHNQFLRYEEQEVTMTVEQFAELLKDNKSTDMMGEEYLVEKVIYNPYAGKAILDYRIKREYSKNLKVEIV